MAADEKHLHTHLAQEVFMKASQQNLPTTKNQGQEKGSVRHLF